VEERVIEALSGDPHTQLVANREVTGRQSPRMMFLVEENCLARAMQTSPFVHPSLECSTGGISELAWVRHLQPLE